MIELEYNIEPVQTYELVVEHLKVILSKVRKWSRAFFPKLRNYGEKTSGRAETENLHHKDDPLIHSRAPLHQNVPSLITRMNSRETEVEAHQIRSLKRPLQTSSSCSEVVPEWVRDKLSGHGSDLLTQQWIAASSFTVTLVSSYSAHILFCKPPLPISITQGKGERLEEEEEEEDTEEGESIFQKEVHGVSTTSYRTRVITLIDGQLVCSCFFMSQYALPCRHILAFISKFSLPFTHLSVHLRWHKAWSMGYFLPHYHRSFRDGFVGVPLLAPFPSLTLSPVSSVNEDDPPPVMSSPPPSPVFDNTPPSSPSSNANNLFRELNFELECLSKDLRSYSSHSREALAWSLKEVKEVRMAILLSYTRDFLHNRNTSTSSSSSLTFLDSTVPTDLPTSSSRALFAYERRRGVAHRTSSKSTQHPPRGSTYTLYDRVPPPSTRRSQNSQTFSHSSDITSPLSPTQTCVSSMDVTSTPPLILALPPLILPDSSDEDNFHL